jgi:16S rRNA G966 N2-methylase RsmD
MLSKVTKPGAIIVCEHESELVLGDSYGDLQLYKRYRYGKVAVTIYRKPSDDTELA